VAADQGVAKRGPVSAFFATRPRTRLGLLLTPPLLWLVVAYLGSIVVLLITAFWSVNGFTGAVVPDFQLGNIVSVFTDPLYREVTIRTILVALSVTVIDAIVALPMAFYMAKIASPRTRAFFLVAVTTPLWASYLVKAYAWRILVEPGGPIAVATGGWAPGFGLPATIMTLAYLWLPYMIIPVYAGFDRVPDSLFEASYDLGASTWRTIRTVAFPLVFPAIVAGSIFTFALSFGDYIAVGIVGGKTQLLANLIYGQLVTANNQPLAAALSVIPLVAVVLYLLAVRRTGALENV
jgi:putative spermidine/putrescine transport system permease protein